MPLPLTEVYNRNADYWDSKLYRAAYHGAYVRLFRNLNPGRSGNHLDRVLDCGLGAGLFIESLIESGQRPRRVYGVDLSTALLRKARAKLRGLGAEPHLAFGDASFLPYDNGQMDLVISALMLEHIPQPVTALQEMARVLRPASMLIVVATRRGAPDHYFRWKYRFEPYPKDAVLGWMSEAGLANVWPLPLTGFARLLARAYVALKR